MRVMVVAVSASEAPSGVCRHAVNLALGLAALPEVESVTVLAGEWQLKYLRESLGLSHERIELLPVEIQNTPLRRNPWFLFGLPRLVRRMRVDVVHLAYPMPVLRRAFRVPVVATLHDLYPFDIPRNFDGRAWKNRAALRLCVRSVHAIACVSVATEERLHALFPSAARKAVVVPNVVPIWPDPSPRRLPGELTAVPFVLCVGQHRANKNLSLLVDAFALAQARGVLDAKCKLVIVGRCGPETEAIYRRVTVHGLADAVLFLQDIGDAALYALYGSCEMVVAPSLVEGFGLPVMEALSAGCRVVCSDIAAFREVGGGECVYFNVHEGSGALVRAFSQVQACPRQRGPSAFLTPREVGERYRLLYSRLLAEQPHEWPDAMAERARVSENL